LKFIPLFKERCKTLREFPEKGNYFFKFDYQYEPKAEKKLFKSREAKDRLNAFIDCISKLDDFKIETIEEALRKLTEEMEIKPAALIHIVRLAATGTSGGPPLFDLLEVLGKDEVEKRLKKALEYIQAKL